jgi:Arylsulfotransferase (ASST)/Ser-Thr-rich glycosyl-phosphatidyl-inositol-anchored membrane family
MKTRRTLCVWTIVATVLGFACVKANAQVPTNFPTFTITTCDTNAVSDGYIILNGGNYVIMLNNDGTPVWFTNTPMSGMDVKLLPSGLLHYAELFQFTATASAQVHHRVLDNSHHVEETIDARNGYVAEGHDFQMLPNGNALVLSYYNTPMDLSRFIPGGWPSALVSGACIQELDSDRNVVWQWRAWDHYAFNPARLLPLTSPLNPVQIAFHINTVTMDTDGNLLVSNVPFDVEKINRQTGDVMWRLGGPFGQFTFLNEDPQEAAAHFACHDVNRLPNGNLLFFCDGDLAGTRSSKTYEYQIDEVKMTAKLVWSYSPNPPVLSWNAGSAQRMPNGNTVIGWGGGGAVPGIATPPTSHQVPAITEVDPTGRVVFEMWFNNTNYNSYRVRRSPYPPQSQAISVARPQIILGNTYDFGAAGVILTVTSGGGVGYNSMTVTREHYAPVYPVFIGKPPRVLPARVTMAGSALIALGADIEFDIATLGITDPANTTVYYRASTGQGIFLPQTTDYNPVTGKLDIPMNLTAQGNDLGEFIFGYPDITEVPYPPILNAVENYRGVQPYEVVAPPAATTGFVYSVNQTLPILLSWSPRGFARSYHLVISTNQDFTDSAVELSDMTDAFYVMAAPDAAATYYYRVETSNVGETSDWSTGSFQTTAPFVQVTVPKGGEAWRRGLPFFVQWSDNLAESVKIDLFKGGSLVRTITTNAPIKGAFKWAIPASLTPGNDYIIQITSVTNSALFATSAQPFTIIDAPVITTSSATWLPNGRLQFGITAPGAAQATVWGTTILSPPNWQNLGPVAVTGGSGTFTNTPPYLFYRVSVP